MINPSEIHADKLLSVWERPELVRLDAADAEGNNGTITDGNNNQNNNRRS